MNLADLLVHSTIEFYASKYTARTIDMCNLVSPFLGFRNNIRPMIKVGGGYIDFGNQARIQSNATGISVARAEAVFYNSVGITLR